MPWTVINVAFAPAVKLPPPEQVDDDTVYDVDPPEPEVTMLMAHAAVVEPTIAGICGALPLGPAPLK